MEKENLSFKIKLSGTFWDRRPEYTILLDDEPIASGAITQDTGVTQLIEFSKEIVEGNHTLKIRLENKTPADTVKDNNDPVNYTIVKDMLLNIVDIEIDDISVGSLLWSSKYILDKPIKINGASVSEMTGCVNLGLNGAYVFEFTSPFYLWLLENI